MNSPDFTSDESPTAQFVVPPTPVEPLSYSAETGSVVPIAMRLVCWFAIILGGCEMISMGRMLSDSILGPLGEMQLFGAVRLSLSIAMVTGGFLTLSPIHRRAGRQILMLWAWGSLILAALLLLRAAGATMIGIPSNRPLWIAGIRFVDSIYSTLSSAIFPALTLV